MAPVRRPSLGARVFAWGGALLFAIALVYFLYAYLVRFGHAAPPGAAGHHAAINVALFSIFALHHSAFARSGMKAAVQRRVGPGLERAVYTWTASVLFLLVCWLWLPLPGALYELTGPAAWIGYALQAVAIGMTAAGSARLDVLDLAGVRPILGRGSPDPPPHPPLETRGLYGLVRHPVYLAWALLVFAAPHMTMTRLVFAATSTAYLVIAIPFEERSLVQTFGADYRAYRQRVRWRMIPGIY